MPRPKRKVPTLLQCVDAIGEPPKHWEARCFEIAVTINRKLELHWKECYGFFNGEIDPRSIFAEKAFVRHGWLEHPDGRVFDPTRWVFEAVRPYIYCQRDAFGEYDFGMEQHWRDSLGAPPKADADERLLDCTVKSKATAAFIKTMFPNYPQLNFHQRYYLAHLGPTFLAEHAAVIYQKLIDLKEGGWIPMDFRVAALHGGSYAGFEA